MPKIINVSGEVLFFRNQDPTVPDWCVPIKPITDIGTVYTGHNFTGRDGKSQVTKRDWKSTLDGELAIDKIEQNYPNAIIVGFESQAVAYPGRVVAPIVFRAKATVYDAEGNVFDDETVYEDDKFISY